MALREASLDAGYERLGRLGRGGQGTTWRARRHADGRIVALKVLDVRALDDWKQLELFERECATLASLTHPGIPAFIEAFVDPAGPQYVLVMEPFDGEPLSTGLTEGRTLSEDALWSLLRQGLEVLEYLHGRQPPVIHRDVKPANLIVRPGGQVGLVDFGGVRLAIRPEGGSTVVGTFGYMAPEQLHGDATPATDLFALGATIAALATGREADELPRRGLRVDLEAVMAPGPLRDLLGALLTPDPDGRPATVAAVRALMDAGPGAAHAIGTSTAIDVAEPDPPRTRWGRRPDLHTLPAPLRRVVWAALWVLGTLANIALMFTETTVIPTIARIAGRRSSARRRDRIEARAADARSRVRRGREVAKALAAANDPDRHRARPKLPPPGTMGPYRRDRGGSQGRRGPRGGGRGRGRGRGGR